MRLPVRLKTSERTYLRNVGAHLGGIYGAKAFELVILAAVTRATKLSEVGVVFYAIAFGSALFQLADLGLFPMLFRRAARAEVGPALLAWATLARAAGVFVLVVPFLLVARAKFPDHAAVATTFFVLAGLHIVHEVPRAILAGRERFVHLGSIAVATKALEAACTVTGVFLGMGVWAWALGRALQNLAMLAVCYVLAHRQVSGFPSPTPKRALREGVPFWLATGVGSALSQLDTVVVGTYLGFAETARLGIAGRVVGGVLGVVGSMMNVAFPALARQNRRFPSKTQVRAVLFAAVGLTVPILFGAPLIIRIVTGRSDHEAAAVARALSPVVLFAVLDRGLTTWLQAKNKERGIAILTGIASVISALALIVLIPTFKTTGAAYARVFREAITSLALLLFTYLSSRRVTHLTSFGVSKLPFVPSLVRARLASTTERIAAALAGDPRVQSVEVSGSGGKPQAFVPGESDLDFVVTTPAVGSDLDAVAKHCDRVVLRTRFTGPAYAQLVHPDVLGWARREGHPVLARSHTRVLWGRPPAPEIDATNARAWALTHAASLFIRMQGYAIEDARHDGATRSDRVAKEFRFILRRLGEQRTESAFDVMRQKGHDLPDWLARARAAPDWLSPEITADLFLAAHDALGDAFREASYDWCPNPKDASRPPEWLSRVADVVDARAISEGATAVHLTPTGPTHDDPMLAVLASSWSRPEWLAFIAENATLGRLPSPFRAYRWPVVIPEAVLAADCLVEHAALFHSARAQGGVDLRGSTVRSLTPPADILRAAALRETIQALVRVTRDRTRVSKRAVFHSTELGEPTGLADAWPFRVRAFIEGRLASLSLVIDHGVLLPDREAVSEAYCSRYDDPLSAIMRERPAQPSGARIAEVLDAWASSRRERLSTLLPLG